MIDDWAVLLVFSFPPESTSRSSSNCLSDVSFFAFQCLFLLLPQFSSPSLSTDFPLFLGVLPFLSLLALSVTFQICCSLQLCTSVLLRCCSELQYSVYVMPSSMPFFWAVYESYCIVKHDRSPAVHLAVSSCFTPLTSTSVGLKCNLSGFSTDHQVTSMWTTFCHGVWIWCLRWQNQVTCKIPASCLPSRFVYLAQILHLLHSSVPSPLWR